MHIKLFVLRDISNTYNLGKLHTDFFTLIRLMTLIDVSDLNILGHRGSIPLCFWMHDGTADWSGSITAMANTSSHADLTVLTRV